LKNLFFKFDFYFEKWYNKINSKLGGIDMSSIWRLCIAAALAVGLLGCKRIPDRPKPAPEQVQNQTTVAVDPDKQLLRSVESREAAEALAEQYEIVYILC
jgi:hypothetical protein